jgi:hypothetical protein
MNPETPESYFAQWWASEVAAAPAAHPEETPECLSFAALERLADVGARRTLDEVRHLNECALCGWRWERFLPSPEQEEELVLNDPLLLQAAPNVDHAAGGDQALAARLVPATFAAADRNGVAVVELTSGPFLSEDGNSLVFRVSVHEPQLPRERWPVRLRMVVPENHQRLRTFELTGPSDQLLKVRLPAHLRETWKEISNAKEMPFCFVLTPGKGTMVGTRQAARGDHDRRRPHPRSPASVAGRLYPFPSLGRGWTPRL